MSANLCPRCAALVQPGAKIQLLDLRADPLAPKADTLARRFPVCWVQPLRFLRVGARPTFGRVGAYPARRARPGWRPAFRIQVHIKPLVPRQTPHKTTARQDKGQAGVTPHGLCRDCPAPREDSVSGNRTANRQKRSGRRGSRTAGYASLSSAYVPTRWLTRPAEPHLPRTDSAALTMLMVGFFPQ